MPLPRSCSPLQCGLCLSEEAGYPGNAANHRCHIWHNEKTHERRQISRWEKGEVTLHFSASIKSKKITSVICIQNKVSLKRSKEEGNNSQDCRHLLIVQSAVCIQSANLRRCVFFFSFYTNTIMYSRGLGVKYQAHANAITSYLHSH